MKANWLATGGGFSLGGLIGLLGGPLVAGASALGGAAIGYFLGDAITNEAKKLVHPLGLQAALAGVTSTLAATVGTSGVAKAAATALYAYLKAHGADGSPTLAQLVQTFQSQSNTDPQAVQLTGALSVTSVYDTKTAAALTLYTHDPIPPATAPAPQPAPSATDVMNPMVPGAAATSGYTLYMYLKAHGNSATDSNLHKLVQQFQIDVDTDPKYPGPAPGAVPPIVFPTTLPQTGVYDANTAKALSVLTNDSISP